jgi:hypothetical protein
MRYLLSIFVVSIMASACLSAWAEGTYTCQASVFMWDTYAKRPSIVSPDGSKHVQLWSSAKDPEPEEGNFYASIYAGPRLLKTILLQNLSAATFVKWSPDSKAFYVMWSDGGAIGGYHVRVFIVSNDQATESPAPKNVAADFAQHHYCKTRGNNLYAVRWKEGRKQLLLQPSVYPTSDCGKEMGFASGYLVDTETGEIKERYTAEQMKQLTKGCPSTVFPTAFATQQAVDSAVKDGKVQKH